MSAALPLSESTLMELLVHNRRNLSGRDKRKPRGFTLLPACTRVAFQTPCGSPIASLLGLKEPLGLLFPARLPMRAAQLRKRSTLRRFRSSCTSFPIHRTPRLSRSGLNLAKRKRAYLHTPCHLRPRARKDHRRARDGNAPRQDETRAARRVLLSAEMEK